MNQPALQVPHLMPALLRMEQIVADVSLPEGLAELIHIRASQINGCAFCLDMHTKIALKDGETPQRLFTVAAWREDPSFTDAERAALALTEAVTRMADRSDAVPDDVWEEAAKQFDEVQLSAVVVHIAAINFWNRLNVTTRQPPGFEV